VPSLWRLEVATIAIQPDKQFNLDTECHYDSKTSAERLKPAAPARHTAPPGDRP
jgi:hypothetical protein